MLKGFTKVAALGLAGLALRAPAPLNVGPIEFEVVTSDMHGFER
ncbi:hypothetical protein OAI45_04280 [Planktomarina temperata]|nr:hypothetical protein [Planktomarina temperata]